jgi:hypothetical protein
MSVIPTEPWGFKHYVLILFCDTYRVPITVALRSKAWTVFPRSDIGIVGSNPNKGMGVCVHLFCVYVVLCVGSCLARGLSPVQGVLPTMYSYR